MQGSKAARLACLHLDRDHGFSDRDDVVHLRLGLRFLAQPEEEIGLYEEWTIMKEVLSHELLTDTAGVDEGWICGALQVDESQPQATAEQTHIHEQDLESAIQSLCRERNPIGARMPDLVDDAGPTQQIRRRLDLVQEQQGPARKHRGAISQFEQLQDLDRVSRCEERGCISVRLEVDLQERIEVHLGQHAREVGLSDLSSAPDDQGLAAGARDSLPQVGQSVAFHFPETVEM